LLRDREVLGESVRAVDRHGTGDSDQLAGFGIEDFREFVIKNLFADFHGSGPPSNFITYIYSRLREFCILFELLSMRSLLAFEALTVKDFGLFF
jgi:hypothetical protein